MRFQNCREEHHERGSFYALNAFAAGLSVARVGKRNFHLADGIPVICHDRTREDQPILATTGSPLLLSDDGHASNAWLNIFHFAEIHSRICALDVPVNLLDLVQEK
jgi:hypothetical protein